MAAVRFLVVFATLFFIAARWGSRPFRHLGGPSDGDCFAHKRFPAPREHSFVQPAACGGPPVSVYDRLDFLAHAAQIAPARITVINSAAVARVSV
jgi:hypothetical protein